MKRYNLVNNVLGWLAFAIAAVTYLLTVEPTASFWDCPEFITQGFKLEVGHPPGNPIFMLTARFFVTLFGGTAQSAALAVNCMSALLSAGTILLLFWTITHLTRRLIVDDDATTISPVKTLVIMAAGLCGALAYTWSDTFWFSAVEGEVYAFSSFCTALVFWLILKWENRANQPHSDRYLVLIAYIIGVSIAVHLLNLLCIPAIVLVFYYRKAKDANVKGSLIALALSAVIVFFILYGLVPGFIDVAQVFELLFVNTFGCPYNTGVLVYAALVLAVFIWTVRQLYLQRSPGKIKLGVLLSIVLSGMPFVGETWIAPVIIIPALAIYLWGFCKQIPVRVFNVLILSVLVIFIGYSSYALLLIRSSADTPMNQNSPDNVFDLASYLNRKQYGERPLIYGPTAAEELNRVPLGYDDQDNMIYGVEVDVNGFPKTQPVRGIVYEDGAPVDLGEDEYAKIVKENPGDPDRYVRKVHHPDYKTSSSLNMLFPRTYSSDVKHLRNYKSWAEYVNPDFESIPVAKRQEWAQRGYVTEQELLPYLNNMTEIDMGTTSDGYGNTTPYTTMAWKLGLGTNLRYFLNYQLNHMYWRYFMWNFAGRQNDMAGNGEPHLGNWISGIPALDKLRLGDQSTLPDEFGKDNPGHNVFYMLPLLLGLIGLLWQSLAKHKNGQGKRGIEQFWVVFFLFFMTGIAIVLYLNQTPAQPRERDYAFAGSFYAFAIWIGLGVPALYRGITVLLKRLQNQQTARWIAAAVASVVGIAVPLQMVSQTWDDHDRSGRYTTRDFGMNYLNSLDDNAIIFTYGDNDTFPLWYAQEVEGCRTDVKVANLSYLETDWYANQMRQQTYEAAPVPMYAGPADYAYGGLWMQRLVDESDSLARVPRNAAIALPQFYAGTSPALARLRNKYRLSDEEARHILADGAMYATIDTVATRAVFGRVPQTCDSLHGGPYMDLYIDRVPKNCGQSTTLTLDMIANSAAGGWKRPVYFATTVPTEYYLGFGPSMYITGMAKMVTPFVNSAESPVLDRAYRNILTKFRWGNLDSGKNIYLDETVRRMVSSTRLAILEAAGDLMVNPMEPATQWAKDYARKHNQPVPATHADMARTLLQTMEKHLPESAAQYEQMLDLQVIELYGRLWALTGNQADYQRARQLTDAAIKRYGQFTRYAASLTPGERGQFGSGDRQALNYLGIAVGFRNYLDLRQAMLRAKAPADELEALDATFGIDPGYEAYYYMYVMQPDRATLEELVDYNPNAGTAVNCLLQMHSKYAVNPAANSAKAAKDAGIDMTAWRKVLRHG